MDWEQKRMLEKAGILRRRTPMRILLEEEEETDDSDEASEDPFEDDGDDLFGDAEPEEDDDKEDSLTDNRQPPEELSPSDIENFGSPRFLDVETKLTNMFNDAVTSAAAAAQHLEAYPGEAIPEGTPAKDDTPDEGEEKNESFYRLGDKRDKWLIKEAARLLLEAEEEGSAADEFDMERFSTEVANYMDVVTTTQDVEAGIFNAARQMILNNFGQATEQEFVDMLSAVTDGKWGFLPTSVPDYSPETPVAVGATAGGGAV
jgi:hypothetical protein